MDVDISLWDGIVMLAMFAFVAYFIWHIAYNKGYDEGKAQKGK